MTFEELLKACSSGKMPQVRIKSLIRRGTKGPAYNPVGYVVEIIFPPLSEKKREWYGCAVYFDGVPYNIWFNAESGTDKRSHYMSELTLIQE